MGHARVLLAVLATLFIGNATLLLVVSAARWRLPYNSEGRYFDANEGVVYHLQSAELFTIAGIVLLLVGLAFGVAAVRRGRHRSTTTTESARMP